MSTGPEQASKAVAGSQDMGMSVVVWCMACMLLALDVVVRVKSKQVV